MIRQWIHYRLIIKSGLFDKHYYLRTYPDVRRADINPIMHFITTGWAEGRDPSASFSTHNYLEDYPDVRHAGINPLIHYIRFGQREGRVPRGGDHKTHPGLPQQEGSGLEVSSFANPGLARVVTPHIAKTALFEHRNNWLDKDVLELITKFLG